MTRLLARLSLFVLLGVAANVMVAWSIGALVDFEKVEVEYGLVRAGDGWTDVLVCRRFGGVRIVCLDGVGRCGNSMESLLSEEELWRRGIYKDVTALVPRWSHTRDPIGHERGLRCDLWTERATGWPFLSLRCETDAVLISYLLERADLSANAGVTGGFFVAMDSSGSLPSDLRVLPTRPVWAGFVANTLVFTVTLWFAAPGASWMRRAIRRRRGLCPMCAYCLLGGAYRGCPECGWNRGAVVES